MFNTFELQNTNLLQIQFIDQDRPAVSEDTFYFNEDLFNNCPDWVTLNGFFQSEKYFLNVSDDGEIFTTI